MGKSTAKIKRRQLDNFYESVREISAKYLPEKGWIHEVRIALGMSAADLAERMGVIRQRVDRLERDEVDGRVTVGSLRKAAEALDCDLIYLIVPRTSLQISLNERAFHAAKEIATEVEHTMKLEAQGTNKRSQQALIQDIANEMILRNDRRIWKKK